MEKKPTIVEKVTAQEAEYDSNVEKQNSSTPIHSKTTTSDINDYYSPLLSQYTQGENDNIDVMWDWNSPQSKPRIRKQKRIQLQQSPKMPIKRQSSNNHIPAFEKLKEELETLRDQIISEHTETNTASVLNLKCTEKKPANLSNLEDVFNDSMDEQLLRCSQEAINAVHKPVDVTLNQDTKQLHTNNQMATSCIRTSEAVLKSESYGADNVNNFVSKYLDTNENKIADDSFDYLLETFKDEDLLHNEELPQQPIKQNYSDVQRKEKSETHPFEGKAGSGNNTIQCTTQEIEQKRRQALAKLESKKKQALPENESPIKCSPEEIEKKRLQALAKLEEKKKLEIIERKRQEALKRLEMNKKKRVMQVETAITSKVYSP